MTLPPNSLVGRREVLRVDPINASVTIYSNGTAERPMINPNWPVFDAAGNLYVTDSGTWKGDDGCIFRIAPGGATEVWSMQSSNFRNGAALSANGWHRTRLIPGCTGIPLCYPQVSA